jgi:CIC family chloride channel protein
MGAVFAAAARAPMTAIIILFEMTGDYRIIGPLMVACVVSTLMSEVLSRESIYTLKLARRGVDVLGAEPDLLDTIPAGKAMTTEFEVAQPDLAVRDLLGRCAAWDLTVLPVMDDAQKLLGVVTRWSVEEAMLRGKPDEVARDLMIPSPVSCSEEESLTLALDRLNAHDLAALPVVAETDRERLVGMLRRRDIIDAYQKERLERPEFAARLDHLRETAAGARMLEVVVEEEAPAAGRAVRDLELPVETLLVSVRRGQRTMIPRGDTVIRPGDRVLALAERESFEALRRLFSRPA